MLLQVKVLNFWLMTYAGLETLMVRSDRVDSDQDHAFGI